MPDHVKPVLKTLHLSEELDRADAVLAADQWTTRTTNRWDGVDFRGPKPGYSIHETETELQVITVFKGSLAAPVTSFRHWMVVAPAQIGPPAGPTAGGGIRELYFLRRGAKGEFHGLVDHYRPGVPIPWFEPRQEMEDPAPLRRRIAETLILNTSGKALRWYSDALLGSIGSSTALIGREETRKLLERHFEPGLSRSVRLPVCEAMSKAFPLELEEKCVELLRGTAAESEFRVRLRKVQEKLRSSGVEYTKRYCGCRSDEEAVAFIRRLAAAKNQTSRQIARSLLAQLGEKRHSPGKSR